MLRTKGGAGRVARHCRAREELEEEWRALTHARTHTRKCTPTHARARTAPSLARKDGGQETQESVLPVGLTALLPEKVA